MRSSCKFSCEHGCGGGHDFSTGYDRDSGHGVARHLGADCALAVSTGFVPASYAPPDASVAVHIDGVAVADQPPQDIRGVREHR